VAYPDNVIKALKRMYIVSNGALSRVSDCSLRDFVTHSMPDENICKMKIAHIPTRDIAYILQYGVSPSGRVVYRDGNRSNHSKENLLDISYENYDKAVSVALQVLAETEKRDIVINSPKDLIRYLSSKGLEAAGYEKVTAIIKLSKLGRVQKDRAMKYIRSIIATSV
jgi:hypothetical protein